jgi:hypothetical protein
MRISSSNHPCLGGTCPSSLLYVQLVLRRSGWEGIPLSAVWLAVVGAGGMTTRMTSSASLVGFKRSGRRQPRGLVLGGGGPAKSSRWLMEARSQNPAMELGPQN